MSISFDRDNANGLYCGLLAEIKQRVSWIESVLNKRVALDEVARYEFCFLQIRIVCELIAIGCLVAHGNIPGTQTKKLQKSWNADEIMRELEKLHPDFYPIPTMEIRNEPHKRDLQDINSGFLSKSELLQTYGRCGDILHRGNARNIHIHRQSGEQDIDKVFRITQRIITLMDHHKIMLLSGDILVCAINMFSPAEVYVAYAQRNP